MAQHPASERKRRRLRKQGDVAPVDGVALAAGTLGLGLAFLVAGTGAARGLARGLALVLADPRPEALGPAAEALGGALAWGGVGALVLALAAALPAWAATGFLWAPARWMPGLQLGWRPRIQAGARQLLGAGGAALGLVLLAPRARALAEAVPPGGVARAAAGWLQGAGLAGGVLALLAGVLGFLAARRAYEARIAMSEDERRRELAEDAGNPAVRRQRDELAARLLGVGAGGGGGSAAGMVDMASPGGEA